jgi:spermidine/putrescine transport system ATP-binding protein
MVLLAVRPEKIRMWPAPELAPSESNLMHGRVVDVSYAGPFTRYGVIVAESQISVMEQNEGAGPRARVGEEVWLTWRVEQTLVLPGTRQEADLGQRAAVAATG